MKSINVRGVINTLSDSEMKMVKGGKYVAAPDPNNPVPAITDDVELNNVVIIGSGTPCAGHGIIFGDCAGTSARSGDQCDYVRDHYYYVGQCVGNGDPINSVTTADYTILGSNGLTCNGGGIGEPCETEYFPYNFFWGIDSI